MANPLLERPANMLGHLSCRASRSQWKLEVSAVAQLLFQARLYFGWSSSTRLWHPS